MTLDELKARAKADLDNAFEKGKSQGGGDGFRDLYWDTLQNNGNPTHYNYSFAYNWNDEVFQPKHNIVATQCNGMFHSSNITSLKGKLDALGITLDVSRCNSLLQMFQGTNIKDVPIIDASNATSISYTFGSRPKVETIEKLILSNKLTNVGNAFQSAENLIHCIFEGTIAISGMDLHWSTNLDAESYDSLIKCYDKTKSLTLTLPPEATVRSVYDAKFGDGAWDTITAEYPNVTIMYS